jgi:RNA polymerase sigma-70 factor (ECF subfamily)
MTEMDRSSELQLVDRLRAGDAEAFDEVHEIFNGRLFNFLARLSGRREVAEDLLEEVWLRLVLHAARLRSETYLGPWLFTVARRLHASYCRSRLLEDTHAVSLLGLWPCGAPARSPFEIAEASETGERLAGALRSLPLAYREALLLVGVEGMKPAVAAGVCGVTPAAMRQRLSRARALLARRLEEAEAANLTILTEVTT